MNHSKPQLQASLSPDTSFRDDSIRMLANSKEPLSIKLTNDYAFKKAVSNKTVMRGLLKALIPLGDVEIKDIEFINPSLSGEAYKDKEGLLDIRLYLSNQTKVNVEMQVNFFAHWCERTLFYTSKMFIESFHGGQQYEELEPCIHIGILNFNFFSSPSFHHEYEIMDKATGENYTRKMKFFVIELKKAADATEAEKKTDLYKWTQLISTDDREVMCNMAKGNKSMEAAVAELEKINQSPEERYLYLRRQMALSDEATQKNYWTKVGEDKAAEQIKTAELKVVEAESKVVEAESKVVEAESKVAEAASKVVEVKSEAEKRIKEEKINIARQLLEKLPLETIAITVGLSVDELNKLKN